MLPGVNPRQMQKMMKRMGIQQLELDAEEVIIRLADKDIIIRNPNVSKVNMMGQQTYQVVGEEHIVERSTAPDISDEDIRTVMQQANVGKEKALEAIKNHKGDLAEAILELQSE
ncbi:nascent polypeptide-associated complex protein [Candidatus Woesearchaeota archaeon]|nr:nascent polypeptide-associated complex protein [Candidatus Woesearchaeota archaeon]